MRSHFKLLAFTLVAVAGLYLYHNVLPYHFSEQKPVQTEDLTGAYDYQHEQGTFHGQTALSYLIPEVTRYTSVLGENSSNKRIEVDLTTQHLYAFEGDQKVYDFFISSGKWFPTPTGTFHIWTKIRYTKMEGGNPAWGTYYYLPNVPYVMFFSNSEIAASRGFSLHGTYWHNNFGHPMSHGCVNMRTEDVEKIYYWADPDLRGKTSIPASQDNPGTPIIIYGQAPAE